MGGRGLGDFGGIGVALIIDTVIGGGLVLADVGFGI